MAPRLVSFNATTVVTIDFGNPKNVVFIGSMSFDHVIDIIADDACMLYFVKKMYRDSGRFVFHGVSLVKNRAVY